MYRPAQRKCVNTTLYTAPYIWSEPLLGRGAGQEDGRVDVVHLAEGARHEVVGGAGGGQQRVGTHGAAQVAHLGHHAGAEQRASDVADVARLGVCQLGQLGAGLLDELVNGAILNLGEHSSLHPLVACASPAAAAAALAVPAGARVRAMRSGVGSVSLYSGGRHS